MFWLLFNIFEEVVKYLPYYIENYYYYIWFENFDLPNSNFEKGVSQLLKYL
jgi:hypothetical protein